MIRIGLLSALLATLTACAQAPEFDADVLDTHLAHAVADSHIPGVVAMVVDKDHILYSGAFGDRNVARNVAMTSDSIFRIASMTKPVTSVAVQMLIEEGHVALDDPIAVHLPEWAGREILVAFNNQDGGYTSRPAEVEMTVRHLLTHTSGLGYPFSSDVVTRLLGTSTRSPASPALPLLHEPGSRWTYGASTRVLGTLVERVSGQPLEQFMRSRIFDPLGMTETSYNVPREKMDRVVTVHEMKAGELTEVPNPDTITVERPAGDGGLTSTATDYTRFIQLFLNNGRAPDGRQLISEGSVALMATDHIAPVRVSRQQTADPFSSQDFPLGADRDAFGLGFQVTGSHDVRDMRSPGSLSWAGIYNTQFWIDPEEGLGGVLLMQYLPFYDTAAIDTLQGFERLIYSR